MNIPKTNASRGVKRVWGMDLHGWEQLMLVSLAVAALAAVFVTVTTASVVRLQKEEAAHATSELDKYKAGAAAELGKAHEGVAKANEAAAKANERVADLSTQAEQLRKDAAEANAKLGATQADVAKANAEIAAANERTEAMRRQNLELENAVAPRLLMQWPAAAPLKQFPGIRVFIGAVPDFEARRLAGQMVPLFQMGDWNAELANLEDIWRDGVEIEYEGGVRFDPQYPDDIMRALEHNANALQGQAAEALGEVLRLQKIEASVRRLPFSRGDKPRRPGVPSDAISVKVGAKPTRYFMDQRIPPEVKAKIEEAERNAAEIIERTRRERGLPETPK